MAYSSPRDELLVAILVGLLALQFDGSLGHILAVVAIIVGIGAYLTKGVVRS